MFCAVSRNPHWHKPCHQQIAVTEWGVQVLEDQGEEIEAAQTAAVASAAASEDLHASLEGQLRASHADVGRLQSEVRRLKEAAESAAAAAVASAPPVSGKILQVEADLEGKLQLSQAAVKRLQAEITALRHGISADVESPVSRDGSAASVPGRSAISRAALPNGSSQGEQHAEIKQPRLTLLCFT